jgi:hypothetical protein
MSEFYQPVILYRRRICQRENFKNVGYMKELEKKQKIIMINKQKR